VRWLSPQAPATLLHCTALHCHCHYTALHCSVTRGPAAPLCHRGRAVTLLVAAAVCGAGPARRCLQCTACPGTTRASTISIKPGWWGGWSLSSYGDSPPHSWLVVLCCVGRAGWGCLTGSGRPARRSLAKLGVLLQQGAPPLYSPVHCPVRSGPVHCPVQSCPVQSSLVQSSSPVQ
jgi:hypothetical protein